MKKENDTKYYVRVYQKDDVMCRYLSFSRSRDLAQTGCGSFNSLKPLNAAQGKDTILSFRTEKDALDCAKKSVVMAGLDLDLLVIEILAVPDIHLEDSKKTQYRYTTKKETL